MPSSNANATANAPHATMLDDATSLAIGDVEPQAKSLAVGHYQAKPHPCARYFVDLLRAFVKSTADFIQDIASPVER